MRVKLSGEGELRREAAAISVAPSKRLAEITPEIEAGRDELVKLLDERAAAIFEGRSEALVVSLEGKIESAHLQLEPLEREADAIAAEVSAASERRADLVREADVCCSGGRRGRARDGASRACV